MFFQRKTEEPDFAIETRIEAILAFFGAFLAKSGRVSFWTKKD